MDRVTWLGILLRPLVALALFLAAALLARLVLRLIPAGRFKAYISKPMPVIPRTEAERKDWRPVLWIWGAIALIFGIVYLLSR